MKILLTAINAKFIHSSLALRCLQQYANSYAKDITMVEYTINQNEDFMLKDIYVKKPDILCISCYLWNISMVQALAENMKKILPEVVIVLGGPEVSYDTKTVLKENPSVDMVIRGEGELTFSQLAEKWVKGDTDFSHILGITYRKGEKIFENPPQIPLDMDTIPFVYEDLSLLNHRILYYETQRGCPYQCQYCLSSLEKGVRFRSLELVKKDLQFFLDKNVTQVKFVDRTFNANLTHAKGIWQYLMEHDNGVSNFHMEITADILDDESIALLKNARAGLFQFEIGVQSTNTDTITAIRRNTSFEKLTGVVKKIKQGGNIHQHLDLIVGLPHENYDSFRKSFNDVYALKPEQFQLGFLKLLKGSGLRRDAKDYGIIYRKEAVYEVLYTDDLPFDDVLQLKRVEEMIETYYNSGKTWYTLQFVTGLFPTPFDCYQTLGDDWEEKGHHRVQHNKIELYTIFYEFAKGNLILYPFLEQIKNLLRFDLFLNDNLKTLPDWLSFDPMEKQLQWNFFNDKERVDTTSQDFADMTPKELSKSCYFGVFDFDILSFYQCSENGLVKKESPILFYYGKRDRVTNHSQVYGVKGGNE